MQIATKTNHHTSGVGMTEKKKYHDLWYLQLNQNSVSYLLYFLKTAPVQQIKEQVSEIARFDWSSNHIAVEWESFVANEHTHQYTEEPTRKVWAIRDVLQPVTKLVFPQWIMDRYKEALDQHVRGEWMSSISLCGDIVEFIVYEFWRAYNEDIPHERRKTPAYSTENNLQTLNECDKSGENQVKIIDKDDYERLVSVRRMRDTHVHYRLRDTLLKDYPQRLKSDNIEALKKLAEFFTLENMSSKYGKYLDYAMKEQAEATEKKESQDGKLSL